jgi:hypothetical protein
MFAIKNQKIRDKATSTMRISIKRILETILLKTIILSLSSNYQQASNRTLAILYRDKKIKTSTLRIYLQFGMVLSTLCPW